MKPSDRLQATGHMLREAGHWILLFLLLATPLLYGGSWTYSSLLFVLVGISAFSLWTIGHLLSVRRPRLYPALILSSVALLAYGWFVSWNAHHFYDSEFFYLVPIQSPFPELPGSLSKPASIQRMVVLSVQIALFLQWCSAFRTSAWRQRSLFALGAAGAAVAILGCLQTLSHAEGPYWVRQVAETSFFGTFYYHGHAGAFLNLCWPASLAGLLDSSEKKNPGLSRWHGLCLSLITASLVINTSRASLGLLFPLLLLALILNRSSIHKGMNGWGMGRGLLFFACLAGLVAVVYFANPSHSGFARWSSWENADYAFDMKRSIVYQICFNITEKYPWFGTGPETFAIAFPFHSGELGHLVPGVWRNAHCDYLQILVEWGRVGTLLWLLFLATAGMPVARKLLLQIREGKVDRVQQRCALVALAGVFGHALIDFPWQNLSIQLVTLVWLALCAYRPRSS